MDRKSKCHPLIYSYLYIAVHTLTPAPILVLQIRLEDKGELHDAFKLMDVIFLQPSTLQRSAVAHSLSCRFRKCSRPQEKSGFYLPVVQKILSRKGALRVIFNGLGGRFAR